MSSVRKTSLRSVQQTQDAIIDTLRRAGEPISAPELFRRMGMDPGVAAVVADYDAALLQIDTAIQKATEATP